MSKKTIIGVSGVATSGKDSLCRLIQGKYNGVYKITRYALADKLKKEIDPYLKDSFGISAFTTNQEEKKLIRPLLVKHGKIRREMTHGRYWTEALQEDLEKDTESDIIIITDIRYDFYERDEAFWLQKEMGGKLIHLIRKDEDGSEVMPPNDDEKENDPKLRSKADLRIIWPTFINNGVFYDYMAHKFLEDTYKTIENWKNETNTMKIVN